LQIKSLHAHFSGSGGHALMINFLFRKTAKPLPLPQAIDLRPILAAARVRKQQSPAAARLIALMQNGPDRKAAE
jgi:hypothetical protein